MARPRSAPSPELFRQARIAIPALRNGLVQWFQKSARTLPWRKSPGAPDPMLSAHQGRGRIRFRRHPYATWISEIMLQQTQVATALPHFKRWMEKFPDVQSLARAGEDEVLKQWAGLGYYARVRNARRAAQAITQAGSFPATAAEWMGLPGIGAYTAGAIASLSYGLREPILDGNVIRVFSRLFGIDFLPQGGESFRKAYWTLAGFWCDAIRPGDSNEALMEFGALVCVPGKPRCGECPMGKGCVARQRGWEERLPPVRPRAASREVRGVAWVIRRGNRFLLEERKPGEFLAGHWMFPLEWKAGNSKGPARLPQVRHSIMQRRYVLEVRKAMDRNPVKSGVQKKVRWVPAAAMAGVLTNALAEKIWAAAQ